MFDWFLISGRARRIGREPGNPWNSVSYFKYNLSIFPSLRRVWELLNIAEWPLKIMKNNRGNRTSTNRPNGVASSVSQKCDTSLLAVYSTLEDGREYPETSSSALNQVIPDLEPTSEDEQFIYNFLMSTKPIPEPEFTISKTPELSMQYLMAQRKGMPRRPDAPQNERILRYPTVVPIKQNVSPDMLPYSCDDLPAFIVHGNNSR